MKIIRTPVRAEGGITDKERQQMAEIVKKWTKIAFRTERIDKTKITKAIEDLYAAAKLKKPRIIIIPSPLVGRLASGIAAAWWYMNKGNAATSAATYDATYAATDDATRDATRAATYAATYAATSAATEAATDAATYDATYAATDDATHDATRAATYAATEAATDAATYAATSDATHDATYAATYAATEAATDAATYAATDDATRDATLLKIVTKFLGSKNVQFGIECMKSSWRLYQEGNMWAAFLAYAETMRDILGLTELTCWPAYQAWEDAGKEGGFRYMHEEFCMVSDFPKFIRVDNQNRPHCETGPSHEWHDGFSIYHLYGVRFQNIKLWEKIVSRKMSFEEVMKIENMEQRQVALKYIPPMDLIKSMKGKLLDKSNRGNKLYLIPKMQNVLSQDAYYLVYSCPSTGRVYMSGVDPVYAKEHRTADACMAWKHSYSVEEYVNLKAEA